MIVVYIMHAKKHNLHLSSNQLLGQLFNMYFKSPDVSERTINTEANTNVPTLTKKPLRECSQAAAPERLQPEYSGKHQS